MSKRETAVTVRQATDILRESGLPLGTPKGAKHPFVQHLMSLPKGMAMATATELGRAGWNAVLLFAELRAVAIAHKYEREKVNLTPLRRPWSADTEALKRICNDLQKLVHKWDAAVGTDADRRLAPAPLKEVDGKRSYPPHIPGDRLKQCLPELTGELEAARAREQWLEEISKKGSQPVKYQDVVHATRFVRYYDSVTSKRTNARLNMFLRRCWNELGRGDGDLSRESADHLIKRVDKHVSTILGGGAK